MSEPTPSQLQNQPGKSALNYRISTHAESRRRIIDALRKPGIGGASSLSNIDSEAKHDPILAMIDAWSTMVDVLSFYQERIANEGFLRTATERRSVLEMSRLVGYKPCAGVAADTFLSYTIDKGYEQVEICAGAQAQSVPAPGQTPQTYESAVPLTASFDLNRLLPLTALPMIYAGAKDGSNDFYVKGIVGAARPGRPALLWTAKDAPPVVKTILAVEPQPSAGQTRLRLDSPAEAKRPKESLPKELLGWIEKEFKGAEKWLEGKTRIGEDFIRQLIHLHPHRQKEIHAAIANVDPANAVVDDKKGIYVFQISAGLFGGTAGNDHRGKPEEHKPFTLDKTDADGFDASMIYLDNIYEIPQNSFVVIVGPTDRIFVARVSKVAVVARNNYELAARVTRLTLDWIIKGDFPAVMKDVTMKNMKHAIVYAGSLPLEMADIVVDTPIHEEPIELDGVYHTLQAGRDIIITGNKVVKGVTNDGPESAEVAAIANVEIALDPPRTVIHLTGKLSGEYVRKSVVILGNVVPATHGETVRQTLGGGNGSPNQSFPLRQGPLVFVSAPTSTGSKSSLEVRVNGVRWHERSDNPGPLDRTSRVYTVQQDHIGARRVVFGDGVHSARIPSGIDNVTAKYRIGRGLDGDAAPGQISLPITRPMGVKAVTNPVPATGGANPESGESIRANAPRSTTLQDRLVSEADYESFARAFAGVSKARADWLTLPEGRHLCITVAGMQETPLDPAGELFSNLIQAFAQNGDPRLPVKLVPHEPAHLELAVAITIDPDYLWDNVEPAVRAAILSRFGFASCGLGEPFETSPLISCIQQVDGVTAVSVQHLDSSGEPLVTHRANIPVRIEAEPMKLLDGKVLGYQILCFSPQWPETIKLRQWAPANQGGLT